MTRPLLCLDVDGVLCPFIDPGGYREVPTGDGDHVLVSPENTTRLRLLANRFQLVWATAWEDRANQTISPLHGIGDLPVIRCDIALLDDVALLLDGQPPEWPGYHDWKLPWIQRYVGARKYAWIDDEISDRALARNTAENCFIRPNPSVGLTDAHVQQLLLFAEE